MERDLIEQVTLLDTREEYVAWEQRCDEFIESLEEQSRIKRPRSICNRQSVIACIARIESLKDSVRERFVHVSAGYGLRWREIDAVFENRVLTGAVINSGHIEPRQFLEDAGSVVLERVRGAIERHGSVKANTAFNGEFVVGDKRTVMGINTKNCELYPASNVREWYERHVIEPTLASLEEFQERDSGWALSRILNLTLNVNKLNPMHAGCCIEVPKKIKDKKAVVNVRSEDNACFALSMVAALYSAKNHVDRISSYPPYANVLNLDGIEFPMKFKDIKKFERLNAVSINVFGIEDGNILPLRLNDDKKEKHVNMLYIQGPRNDGIGHFAWIKNLSRLVGSQINKYGHKKFFCDRCLHYFCSDEKLKSHAVDCDKLNDCAIRLPSEDDKWLTFSNHCRKERVPFIVYADLECVLQKTEDASTPSALSYAYQQHEVFSIGYYVQCSYDTSSAYRFRRDNDCVSWFAGQLEDLAHRVKNIISTNRPMDFTCDDWRKFNSATHCHICEKPFAPDDERARDHCHLTGRYRGPAHVNCNLNYKDSFYIPIVFHNLSGYDAHFVIKEIATKFEGHVDLLPLTKEKYISFTKHVKETSDKDFRNCVKLRFIDSYKFLSASLDKLASYLDKDKLKIVRSEFSALSDEDFNLLTRKGIFPYEYVDCVEKLDDTRLPPRESFRSSLTGDTVSESDYAHAANVWQRFSVRTLGEYSDLYLKTDVLLLADVFENFRDSCVASYDLDPAHYYTLPGFTWDAMLKHTRVKFELLTDVDMVTLIERGIRGGLSQCSGRYAKANNKYMRSYDLSKPSSYLMYYDVNNLYGWAMCQPLPYADFRWVEDAANFDARAIPPDSPTGYILEVDLEYPQHLHDAHADLPFCPTRDKPPGKREDKLLATLYDKQRYVIHYRNLQQCTHHGLRVTKVHRVLQFTQSAWLRNYIELNTQFRTRAKNDFEKNLYKLMNNAIFGKTMENVRDRVDVKLVTTWDGRYGAEAMIPKPNFHSRSIFAENLIAVELRKLEVKFDKPIYVGMCILDISKVCLYEFHHEYMVPTFNENCKIMYTDTDSLIYHVECDDVYAEMKRDIARFDTSDYPMDNAYGMPLANKKVPGLMKDENNGAIMTEFIGLRAKMYALRVDGKEDTKKAKGVKSNVVARTITFNDYTRCLNEEIEMTRRQSCIRSKLHQVYTVSETKITLSPYDDKRYIVSGSTNTLPWGHYHCN
ncbi:PREDICTED: uncharacterized protein LOC108779646 [Cyphomyrmex costatus]|uniref:DNA-directed DNA polymerase n=1 Tax=Cyphomyrmex costatus TaxID=456900 RepID=A0A151IPB3_9HYME|nr:PREDICTED: uncharacterized protein LOC108779646 [Cyphomyrmex costatus]KYN07670.1 hypothetical protein ALC62_01344 [Cyphomyrmex costatus]